MLRFRWFRHRSLEREMEAEFRVHMEMRIRENLQAGMSPEGARVDALRRFGNVNRIKLVNNFEKM